MEAVDVWPVVSLAVTCFGVLLLAELARYWRKGQEKGAKHVTQDARNVVRRGDGTAVTRSDKASDLNPAGLPGVESLGVRERAALAAVKQRLRENRIDLSYFIGPSGETEDAYILRYLIARRYNADKAYTMLSEDCAWRHEVTQKLSDMNGEDVLGTRIANIWPYLPSWTQGFDKEGRPVMYKRWGTCRLSAMLEHTSMENLGKYHIWQTEQAVKLLGQQSAKLGRPVDKFCCVFDAKGWHIGLATKDAMNFLNLITTIDQGHYPERLGVMFVVNAPRMVAYIWAIVRTWLDPVTRKKVHIMASEADWKPAIQQYIDLDELPDIFGGQVPVSVPTGEPTPSVVPVPSHAGAATPRGAANKVHSSGDYSTFSIPQQQPQTGGNRRRLRLPRGPSLLKTRRSASRGTQPPQPATAQ